MNNIITIKNIHDYTQQILNNDLILTKIIPFVDEASLFQRNLRGSCILECNINNTNYDVRKYKRLLILLYSTTNMETIIQNTILNISEQEIYDRGFEYYDALGISIQGADARRTLKEIINIIKIKNYSMKLKIKLRNDEVIEFSI